MISSSKILQLVGVCLLLTMQVNAEISAKNTEQIAAEQIASEQKVPEQIAAEQIASEQKVPEQIAAEQKVPEQNTTAQKVPEQKVPEQIAAEQKVPEQNTTAQNTTAQKTRQSFAYLFENKEHFYQYDVRNRVWKFRVGYRTGGTRDSLNVGLQHDWLTLGSIQRQGAYKIFLDTSRTLAWSSALFQGFYWNITKTSLRPLWGLRLGIDPVQFWVATDDRATRLGAALGYNFGIYELRLLYQHTQREQVNNVASHWDSWFVTVPSSTTLNQLGASQKLRLSKLLFVEWVLLASVSNTEQLRFSSYAQMHVYLETFDLKLGYTQSEQNYIHEDWNYARYLWSTSAELRYNYGRKSYLRTRIVVREYHPFAIDNRLEIPLNQIYSLSWKQYFEKEKSRPIVESQLGYSWNVDDLTHTVLATIRLQFSQFSIYQYNKLNILLNKFYANVEEITYSGKIVYEHSLLQTALRVRGSVQLFVENNLSENIEKQEFRTELGFAIRIVRFRVSAKLSMSLHPSDSSKYTDMEMELGLRYTI